MLETGLITKVNSDTFTVRVNNNFVDCKARGKNRFVSIKPVVGDKVLIDCDKK